MKKLFFIAIVMAIFSSCSGKEEITGNTPEPKGQTVTVSFTGDQSPSLRAQGINVVQAEEWEKELKSITILAFKENGQCVLRRNFTPAEVAERTATITVPNVLPGEPVKFYAVANFTLPSTIKDLSQLEALQDNNFIAGYNSYSYETVAHQAIQGSFPMSGQTSKVMAEAGQITPVSITLKRHVAKIRVKVNVTGEFHRRYSRQLKMDNVFLLNSSRRSWLFERGFGIDERNQVLPQIPFDAGNESWQSLFYVFENDERKAGDRVTLEIRCRYDINGKPEDVTYQNYVMELNIDPEGGGIIRRNCYYFIEVNINGLVEGVQLSATSAGWESPSGGTNDGE